MKSSKLRRRALECAEVEGRLCLGDANEYKKSIAGRLAGNSYQYRALSRRIRTLLGRNKDKYPRSLVEDAVGPLNANDLLPAYQAPKKLLSKPDSQMSVISKANGCLAPDRVVEGAQRSE